MELIEPTIKKKVIFLIAIEFFFIIAYICKDIKLFLQKKFLHFLYEKHHINTFIPSRYEIL